MSAASTIGVLAVIGVVGAGAFFILTSPTKPSSPKPKTAAQHDKEIWDKRRSFAKEDGERYFTQYLADDGFWEEGNSFKTLNAAKKRARSVLKNDEEILKARIYDFGAEKFVATIGA